MKLAFLLRNPLFLREEASDAPEGGAAPASPETPAVEEPAADPAPVAAPAAAAAPVKPGFLASAIAAAKGNGVLAAENSGLRTQVGTLTAQLSALTAERDGLAARVTALEGERAQIQAALDDANSTAQTVQESTVQALAAVGVPRDALPAAAAAEGGDKLSQLNAQLEAATDPVERGRLSNQIWDEMKARANAPKAA